MGNLCFVKNHDYFLNRLHFTSMGFVEVVGTLSLVSLEGSTKLFVFDSSSQFRNFPILPKMVFEAFIIGGLLPSGHWGCDSCLDSVPLLEKWKYSFQFANLHLNRESKKSIFQPEKKMKNHFWPFLGVLSRNSWRVCPIVIKISEDVPWPIKMLDMVYRFTFSNQFICKFLLWKK